jgi:hypothetical protein
MVVVRLTVPIMKFSQPEIASELTLVENMSKWTMDAALDMPTLSTEFPDGGRTATRRKSRRNVRLLVALFEKANRILLLPGSGRWLKNMLHV